MDGMNQKVLVSDLARLEEMTADTNLLIHIARIRKRAENGFYHLQAGTIRNPVTGSEYPVMRRRIGRTDVVDHNCPRDDVLDAEMRLIVDAGCHPDCQHMQHCIRCGPCCKAVHDKLMIENRKED